MPRSLPASSAKRLKLSSPSPASMLDVPCHMTVENKRKAVDVLQWGSSPVITDHHGNLIPHGFQVRTYYKGRWFLATTRVVVNDKDKLPHAEYQFVALGGEDDNQERTLCGEWNYTSSGALQSALDKLGNRVKCVRGTNGALQIGVTYPNLQQALRRIFAKEPAMQSSPPKVTPRAAVAAPPPPPPATPLLTRQRSEEQQQLVARPVLTRSTSNAMMMTTPTSSTTDDSYDLWRDLDIGDFSLAADVDVDGMLHDAGDLQPKPPQLFHLPFHLDSSASFAYCCCPFDTTTPTTC